MVVRLNYKMDGTPFGKSAFPQSQSMKRIIEMWDEHMRKAMSEPMPKWMLPKQKDVRG